jgi:divalent metal cation (Fe/Co/Zn/Cd) transporter
MAAYAWVITAVGLIGIKLEAWIWTGSVSVLAS